MARHRAGPTDQEPKLSRTKKEAPKSDQAASGGASPDKTAPARLLPPIQTAAVLPVKFTTTRAAEGGAELARLNARQRELHQQRTQIAHDLRALDERRIPLEEALSLAAASREKDGEVLVLPIWVDCEARPVAGRPHTYDVFRTDTTPRTLVRQVTVAPKATQETLPGMAIDPSLPEEQRRLSDAITKALRPALNDPGAGDTANADEHEGAHFT
jgi:hypothetical protein